ncbi:hypothetical protein RRF57_005640 [Xylaria bambusicola]|uniref:Uncharacterized protein n=1 Tax=Xylaria bambusicola TaxID=326684 RepID=A0AAN7UNX5_9PEZI
MIRKEEREHDAREEHMEASRLGINQETRMLAAVCAVVGYGPAIIHPLFQIISISIFASEDTTLQRDRLQRSGSEKIRGRVLLLLGEQQQRISLCATAI